MEKTQSDLISRYKLQTEFLQDGVRHIRYVEKAKDRYEKVTEEWSNCGELGEGGFGVVCLQFRKATGHYRAVKTISKRVPAEFDCYREILVMAKLAKVCVLTLEEICSSLLLYLYGIILLCPNGWLFSIRYYMWSSWDGTRKPRLCI